MIQRYAIACGLAGLATVFSAMAEHQTPNRMTFDVALGVLDGKSQENYYDTDTGQLDDQSNWKIKQAPIVKMGMTWDVMPWLSVNAQGWTTFDSRGSSMNEYYWWDSGLNGWSEWDSHPNTRLNYANEFDINLKGWLLNEPQYRLGMMLGYQETRYSWKSTGGNYIYFDGDDWESGDYDNVAYSGYKQNYKSPYIGIVGMYRYQNVEFNAAFKFSPRVKTHGNNDYYDYDETYRTSSSDGRFYSASLDVGYYLTPHAKVYTAFTWSKYKEARGGYQEIDYDDNDVYYYGGNVAGVSNKTYNFSVGLQYSF